MILDTPLDIKGPYSLKGTADVYYSGGKWIARSWPKRPKQPNSTAQISCRDKFKKMLELRTTLPEPELRAWKSALWPPDKTYDDAWRGSMLKNFHANDTLNPPRPMQSANWLSTKIDFAVFPARPRWFYGIAVEETEENWLMTYAKIWQIKDSKKDVVNWEVNGLLCYAGKKIIPHYQPIMPQETSFIDWGVPFTFNGKNYVAWGKLYDTQHPWAFARFYYYQPLKWAMPGYYCIVPENRFCNFDINIIWT